MTQQEALSILKTGKSVFLTGEPGSGKTHTVNTYIAYLRQHGIEPAITASTGIAATHIGGMTIHSWSGIGIKTRLGQYELGKITTSEHIAQRIRRVHVLIIDEVSMLSAQTFSLVDLVCRKIKGSTEPFGGIQVVLVGDFFQLPPIVKPEEHGKEQSMFVSSPSSQFAYESSVWKQLNPVVCYLTEQHRQDDKEFLCVLSALRSGVFEEIHLRCVLSRQISSQDMPENGTKLFSHNVDVDRMNHEKLQKLKGVCKVFEMSSSGARARVTALQKGCLSPERLELKVGAVVMFTKNNPKENFVNGTLGEVVGFDTVSGYPFVKIRYGRRISVQPMDWTVEENGRVQAIITQLPLRLAWAITIHKSQGMSLDEAVMDLSAVFEYGQGYVALSRVRRLAGLYLLGWNDRAFQVHPEILAKDTSFRTASADATVAFAQISHDDLTQRQARFITACGGTLKPILSFQENRSVRVKKERVNTYHKTLLLWKEGKSISQIAQTRRLTEGTILNHIEKLVVQGKIKKDDLSRLITPSLSRALQEIHATFRDLHTDQLSPVFEKLTGMYSYNDLRVARMLLEK